MLISDLPPHRRPREKMREKGADTLSDVELLALILRNGYQGKNALEFAERLLKHHKLSDFLKLELTVLSECKGIGPATASVITAIGTILSRSQNPDIRPAITSPQDVLTLTQHLLGKKQEHLVALYLNARQQLISQQTITMGTINSSLIHARELFAPAISLRAAGLIIVHNHPSGITEPSNEDIETTEKLVEAGSLLDIPILDHVIVSNQGWFSFKHHQLL